MAAILGVDIVHIYTYAECKDISTENLSRGSDVPICRSKTRSIRGSRIPPLERVFNRIDTSAQSLYARARTGDT